MYNQFSELVLGFFTKYGLTTEINDKMITDKSKAKVLIDEFEYNLSKKIARELTIF